MNITEIPSEDLERLLMKYVTSYASDSRIVERDAIWMLSAIEELRLRRLARSAT